jgi:multidrug transporter EmrE-like cation transporter
MDNLASFALAFLGILLVAAGSVVQKMGAPWMGWPGKKDRKFATYFLIWLCGFYVYNLSVVPMSIASKTLPPHIISSISGLGITVIILLSRLFLKERLYATDIIYSLVILAAIFILSILQEPATISHINKPALYALLLLPFLLAVPAFLKQTGSRMKTILFSLVSGISGGLMLVMMNITVNVNESSVESYLGSPYLYLWIGMAVIALIALQFAMKSGEMILIGPLQNSSNIVYPAICSYFIFGISLLWIQILAMMIIVYACAAMLRKHGYIN